MAVKEAKKFSQNGHVSSLPEIRRIEGFQLKYLKKLIANFDHAKLLVQQTQDAANEFIAAVAEEQAIVLGQGGWTFDVERLEFVCVPPSDESE